MKKMNKNIKVSTATIAVFLLVVLAANLAAASTTIPKTVSNTANLAAPSADSISAVSTNPTYTNTPSNAITDKVPPVAVEDLEKLREQIPKTLSEAEANILPIRSRYLMYTNNGVHIMWGTYGNGRFVGTDNQGKSCWGIYGQGIFAGFYNGVFFWGKYNNGEWKAEYIFGLRASQGKYVLFPSPLTTTLAVAP